MTGPFPPGTFKTLGSVTSWERQLTRGIRYRVVKSFIDAHGAQHREGETWYFIGSYFIPYDDELTLLIAMENREEWKMPIKSRSEAHPSLSDKVDEYIEPVDNSISLEYFSTSICSECYTPLEISNPKKCPRCHAVW